MANTISDIEKVSGIIPSLEGAAVEEEFDSIMIDLGVGEGGGIQ